MAKCDDALMTCLIWEDSSFAAPRRAIYANDRERTVYVRITRLHFIYPPITTSTSA